MTLTSDRPVETPPILEEWYRRHLDAAEIDISSSGVAPYTFADVRGICGIPQGELDAVVLDDSVSQGGAGLRRAIADRYVDGDDDRVLVTHGSSEAIALTLGALLGPGDHVVLQESIYHSLGHYPERAGCRVSRLPMSAVHDGEIDAGLLARLVVPGTAAVVLNLPHNPSGASLSRRGLDACLERIAEVGATLVWDGATAEITHRWEPLPDPASLYPRTVSYGTLSKTFGLPGLRVGWCVAPPDLIRATFPARDRTTLFLSPLVELVATRAVQCADRLVERRAAPARRNLAHLHEWVDEHADVVRWTPPDGGVCALLEVTEPGGPGTAERVERLCLDLLDQHRTLLVPGSAFDVPHGVRIGFGGAERPFRAGLDRLGPFLRGRRP